MGWVGSKDREYSVILPWLLIGRKEVANNQQLLNKLSITHILNVTRDQPNKFPSSYIYERVPIKDNENEDISEHWPTIINFIGRVEKAKGRVFVHCTVGSSRAPSAVLAYLVYNKGVPLIDAFRYVRTLRPVTLPNHRFLLELAKLEVGARC
ncbi:protein-tyrosine phosphatase-like protein [Ochromonadaceae sp. CCMP2298]|nr:protein-tyrosine phosphatase-like protein [Ochromonadaceae sp. CCMP2298]